MASCKNILMGIENFNCTLINNFGMLPVKRNLTIDDLVVKNIAMGLGKKQTEGCSISHR